MSSDGLTPFELELLGAVADEPRPPAGLALELDADFRRGPIEFSGRPSTRC